MTLMIPITFCASFVPWLKLKIAAERSCSLHDALPIWAGVFRRTTHAMRIIIDEPSTMPMSGDSTMNATILMIPAGTRPAKPSDGIVAPIIPPASAWEEEDGRPHHQVTRFQTIAPMSAAKTTRRTTVVPSALRWAKSTIPVPIVAATLSSAPHRTGAAETKLKKAAHATAQSGVSTRVETTVAIEFAASWKPLMKSKARATAMSRTTVAMSMGGGSGVLEDDALDDVRDVLSPIGRILDEVDDLLPLHHGERVVPSLEELRHRTARERVRLVLEDVHLLARVEDPVRVVLHVPQPLHRDLHLLDLRDEHGAQLAGLGEDRVDVVEPEPRRGGVGEIEHVVDAGQEPVDLGPVERRYELRVEARERLVGDVVTPVLDVLDRLAFARHVGEVVEERLQELRPLDHGPGLGLEVGEKVVRLRHELLEHRVPPWAARTYWFRPGSQTRSRRRGRAAACDHARHDGGVTLGASHICVSRGAPPERGASVEACALARPVPTLACREPSGASARARQGGIARRTGGSVRSNEVRRQDRARAARGGRPSGRPPRPRVLHGEPGRAPPDGREDADPGRRGPRPLHRAHRHGVRREPAALRGGAAARGLLRVRALGDREDARDPVPPAPLRLDPRDRGRPEDPRRRARLRAAAGPRPGDLRARAGRRRRARALLVAHSGAASRR